MEVATCFNVEVRDGIPILHITGDLDHLSMPEFRTTIAELADEDHAYIILNLGAVDFIDSGGMSGIVFAVKRLSALGGSLHLACCNKHVFHKLQIGGLTKLGKILNTCNTVRNAIEDIHNSCTHPEPSSTG